MVLPASHKVSRVPWYSGSVSESRRFSATGLLPSMVELSRSLRLFSTFVTPYETSYNPERQAFRFGLFPVRSPLLRESLFVFFSSGYLDVSVPRVSSIHPMYSGDGTAPLRAVGFPIRKSSDQSLLAAPRSLSQLTASFIGSWCQGIHRAPL